MSCGRCLSLRLKLSSNHIMVNHKWARSVVLLPDTVPLMYDLASARLMLLVSMSIICEWRGTGYPDSCRNRSEFIHWRDPHCPGSGLSAWVWRCWRFGPLGPVARAFVFWESSSYLIIQKNRFNLILVKSSRNSGQWSQRNSIGFP